MNGYTQQQKYGKRYVGVCAEEAARVIAALEATSDHNMSTIYKYLKESDACLDKARSDSKKPKTSTMYFLSQYLDQRKHKVK